MAEIPSVYLETTVIGYLTSRTSNDQIVAGHQQATREFWAEASSRFRLFVSRLVVQECSAGDAAAVAERMQVLKNIPHLRATSIAADLTKALLQKGGVPSSQPRDVAHIAPAAAHGIQYLVTWNFRHIANAGRRRDIERICRAAGRVEAKAWSDQFGGDVDAMFADLRRLDDSSDAPLVAMPPRTPTIATPTLGGLAYLPAGDAAHQTN
ncbi:MAG: hypothetical protein DCC67_20740 [Planctomycetota bacterium]|nr:MAG: hypothetical protein DCC67_20740 [Planctomycetota bacterium]